MTNRENHLLSERTATRAELADYAIHRSQAADVF
jgi:hypothetical protein